MFNKLLSNLPFNPSLIGQVSFYAKRLHQEASIRRLGVVFVIFAMLLQIFAVIAPPQQTQARTGNDLLPGGVGQKGEIIMHCVNNSYNFRTILHNYYGINCSDLNNGTVSTVNSRDWNGKLYSMGHLPYGLYGEQPVSIKGAGTLYIRPLWAWDHGGSSRYKVLAAHNGVGAIFYILFDCGNLVTIGKPTPPKPPPKKNPPPRRPSTPPPPPEAPPCAVDQTIKSNSPLCIPCPYSTSISKSNTACKPCDKSSNQDDSLSCIELDKTARNSTRNILNADKTTAYPRDVINYSLIVKNTGKATVNGFVVEENLTDVLEYANLVDMHGGEKDSQNVVRWPGENIPAGSSITKFITVKVKDKIPQTPSPVSNPGSFDLVMTNVYGKAINIKVPGGVIKRTEKAVTTTLPNTGPGTTLAIGFGVTALAAYFFARTRLMAKELDSVRKDYASSGGL